MKKPLILILVLGVLAVGVFALVIQPKFRWAGYKTQGRQIISKLETYKANHGVYPEKLSEAGASEDPIWYRKQTNGSYMIWFGTTLGESIWYESTTRRWMP